MEPDSAAYIERSLETSGVDRPTLRSIASLVRSEARAVVVAGLTDYAKHLVNLFPGQIVAIWDDDPDLKDISFRGVPVVAHLPENVDQVIATRFADLYQLQTTMLSEHAPSIRFSYPPNLDGHPTKELLTHLQTPFYQQLIDAPGSGDAAESSMMSFDKIVFLLELLRSTIHLDGDVAEIGVWQGGSAYYLALALAQMEQNKTLFLLDFFEEHPSKHPKGIMCADQLERQFSFFPTTRFIAGDIRQTITELEGRRLSFVHYDMGYQKPIVDVVAAGLVDGGILLLDNYGHLAGRPGMFDDYFGRLGLHVARVPYTEQAIVFRNRSAS